MTSKTVRIGVTGSTGVLGRAVIKNWSDESQRVEFVCFKGDIQNYSEVENWLTNADELHGLLHFAAMVPTAEVDKDPLKAFRVNTLGTLNLMEVCRMRFSTKNCPWMFLTSSSHVYESSSEGRFVTETSPVNPVSTYGLTKAHGDAWSEVYRTRYNLPVCTGRIFSYSAPDQPATYFIPSLVQKIKNAPKDGCLEIRGLEGTRDFVTVGQISEAIQLLFNQKAVGVFNIGTGTAVSLFDVAQAVRLKLDREDVSIISTKTDTHHLAADVKKLNDIGFHISFDMDNFLNSLSTMIKPS